MDKDGNGQGIIDGRVLMMNRIRQKSGMDLLKTKVLPLEKAGVFTVLLGWLNPLNPCLYL
jgi:hypothetical protein